MNELHTAESRGSHLHMDQLFFFTATTYSLKASHRFSLKYSNASGINVRCTQFLCSCVVRICVVL